MVAITEGVLVWTSPERKPEDETYCVVQFADGSVTAAIACASRVNGFRTRHKWTTPSGKRKFKDTAVLSKPIRFFIIPAPLEVG